VQQPLADEVRLVGLLDRLCLLADGVGKFTSPEKRESVKAKLLALAQRG